MQIKSSILCVISEKKGSILWVIPEKRGSILWVISEKRGSILGVISKKRVQFFELFFSILWVVFKKKEFDSLSRIFEKKKFNSLCHIQKKVQFCESYSKKKKGSILWVIFEKSSILWVKQKRSSILWVIPKKDQLFFQGIQWYTVRPGRPQLQWFNSNAEEKRKIQTKKRPIVWVMFKRLKSFNHVKKEVSVLSVISRKGFNSLSHIEKKKALKSLSHIKKCSILWHILLLKVTFFWVILKKKRFNSLSQKRGSFIDTCSKKRVQFFESHRKEKSCWSLWVTSKRKERWSLWVTSKRKERWSLWVIWKNVQFFETYFY